MLALWTSILLYSNTEILICVKFNLISQMAVDRVVPQFSKFLHDDPYVRPYQDEIERRFELFCNLLKRPLRPLNDQVERETSFVICINALSIQDLVHENQHFNHSR